MGLKLSAVPAATLGKCKVRAQLALEEADIQQIEVLSSSLFVAPASQVVPAIHVTLAASAGSPPPPRAE